MSAELNKEIDNLKTDVLTLAAMAEQNLRRAALAVIRRNPELTPEIVERNAALGLATAELEQNCLRLMSMYNPAAPDLRFLVAVLKAGRQLKPVGELAVQIGEDAVWYSQASNARYDPDFSRIAVKTLDLLKDSVTSLIGLNADLAKKVDAGEFETRLTGRQIYRRLCDSNNQQYLATYLLHTNNCFEKIAHHASNIAAEVLFLTDFTHTAGNAAHDIS